MRIIISALLLTIPSIVLADRVFDGLYVSAGYTYFDTNVKIFDEKGKSSEWVPKVSLGYGKSSKHIGDTKYRMYLGIDLFYIGELDRLAYTEEEMNDQEDIIETRREEFEQKSTSGIGARIGLVDDNGSLGGNLYVDFGYATTEIEGMFSITDRNDTVIFGIEQNSVDFKGVYWGIGYELAFGENVALRIEGHSYEYDDEELSLVMGNSTQKSVLTDPNGIDLDNTSLFLGLTGRF